MKIISTNHNNIFQSSQKGAFHLEEDSIYRVETVGDCLNLRSLSTGYYVWCTFSDFRGYLRQGLIKIIVEK